MITRKMSSEEREVYKVLKRQDKAIECAVRVLPSTPETLNKHSEETLTRRGIEASLKRSGFTGARAWLYAKLIVEEEGELLQRFSEWGAFPESILEVMEDCLAMLLKNRSQKGRTAFRRRLLGIERLIRT